MFCLPKTAWPPTCSLLVEVEGPGERDRFELFTYFTLRSRARKQHFPRPSRNFVGGFLDDLPLPLTGRGLRRVLDRLL